MANGESALEVLGGNTDHSEVVHKPLSLWSPSFACLPSEDTYQYMTLQLGWKQGCGLCMSLLSTHQNKPLS